MKLILNARALVALALGSIAVITPVQAGAVDSGRESPAIELGVAAFEGRSIDLTKGWGTAQACAVAEDLTVTCYRTEAAMDRALGVSAISLGDYPTAANGYASCGSSLKLYANTYMVTPVLYLTTRQDWMSLSWFGFDNVTSSYRIGACGASFNSGPYANGSTYPGNTWAYASSFTMGWGWDNLLSSVYIY